MEAQQGPVDGIGFRWRGQRPGAGGAEGLHHVGGEAPPGPGGGVGGAGDHAGVGHQEDDEVFGHEVRAQLPRGLGAACQFGEALVGAVAFGLELPGHRECHGQHAREPPVIGLHRAYLADEGAEPGPRIRVGKRLGDRVRVGGHLGLERARDQVGPGGKPPVQSGHADPRVAGDVLDRHVQAPLRELLLGRGDDALTVALRVGPQPRPGRPGPGAAAAARLRDRLWRA